MDTSEQLEEQLQDALTHLYDPDYQPSELIYDVTGCVPQNGHVPVQSTILETIRDLKPDPTIPPGARARRIYDVIHHRYVLKLTQEETAERMNISVRHLNRVQREAVHTLARTLWESQKIAKESGPEEITLQPHERATDAQAPDWRAQTRHELASLRSSAPGAVSNVAETIDEVIELVGPLISKHDVTVDVGFIQPELVAAIHPSLLHQILITALGRLARYATQGRITLFAGLEDGNVKITIAGTVTTEKRPTESSLMGDFLTPEDVTVSLDEDGEHAFVWVRVPSIEGRITVLAVDDNLDLAHLYRRATAGTRYRIVHVARGQGVFETIEQVAPDVIVLDVMLPDIDGWKLLMRLREDRTTRPIPVIVCSVVREEGLALSLGAALYLPKPVRPRQFIQALDRVLHQAPANAAPSRVNN